MFKVLAAVAFGLPVAPPVERVLKATDGREVDSSIVDVTADSVEIIRRSDASKFKLSIDRLSEEDRVFLSGLYRDLHAKEPLPDTPFMQLVRRDFVRAAEDRKKTAALPADAFAKDRWLVIAVDEGSSAEYMPWSHYNFRGGDITKLPTLWLLPMSSGLRQELAADTLPENHAILSYKAMKAAQSVMDEMVEREWEKASKTNRLKNGKVWELFEDLESELEFEKRVLAKLPDYWPRIPPAGFSTKRREPSPYFFLYNRDGTPAMLRGHPVKGSVLEIVKILETRQDELE